jgi:hypothetical protein
MAFRGHLVAFRELLMAFRGHLVAFRELLMAFRGHLVGFREHLVAFKELLRPPLIFCTHPAPTSAPSGHLVNKRTSFIKFLLNAAVTENQ